MEITVLKNYIKECLAEKETLLEEEAEWSKTFSHAESMMYKTTERRRLIFKRIDVLEILLEEVERAYAERVKKTEGKHTHDLSGLFHDKGLTHIHGGNHTSTIDFSANGFEIELIENEINNELSKER